MEKQKLGALELVPSFFLSLTLLLALVSSLFFLLHLFVLFLLIPRVVVDQILPEPRHGVRRLRRGQLREAGEQHGHDRGLEVLTDRGERRLFFLFEFFFRVETRKHFLTRFRFEFRSPPPGGGKSARSWAHRAIEKSKRWRMGKVVAVEREREKSDDA